jgi:hypothetical protein
MLFLYRCLLYLYPANYRAEFGDEMNATFRAASEDAGGLLERAMFLIRELSGLLSGALQERLIGEADSQLLILSRRRGMRAGFRFPMSTAALMAVILAGVLLAIEKARSVEALMATANLGPGNLTPVAVLAPVLALSCLVAAIGWGMLFALGRSGVHRLAETQGRETRN